MPQNDPRRETKQIDTPTAIRRLSSESLMSGQNRLVILHNGDEYTLRITRQGKLILTK
ncbi:MAG: hemin uptake protein HemP [Candidatus Thiodiazotropha taylori]|nr:hemin uptake protein HemP [Candidatus Thiodiazotropha taylori]MCG8107968.1 hemin uptake protein HemP [Candidatus Thiodiazotropha taylori]MCG8111821.1 hemin uptake protein HemP [Candidatus Thiodiazotropha taylori]MCG8125517.1 hemin uptake protein HemP [Candidatus Thiodiazotropha taylori]MCW4254267.1 hemin uptake protein HemP [Candidatus Thiodiazotropha taylori]